MSMIEVPRAEIKIHSIVFTKTSDMEHRVSDSQLDELLEHLTAHPSLVRGVGLGARSKETVDREWDNLAARLNAHDRGSIKTGQRWKKYWADIKCKAKARAAARRLEASGTGGEPATLEALSETDKKVLAIIRNGAVHESPVSRWLRQPKQSSSSTVTRASRIGKRVEPSWVVELESRRVDNETKLANAAMITAEAAQMQAEAMRMQAEAMRMQAETSRMQADALNKFLDILSKKL